MTEIISVENNPMDEEYVYNTSRTKYRFKTEKKFTRNVYQNREFKPTKGWKQLHRKGLIKLDPDLRFLHNPETDRYVVKSNKNKRKIDDIDRETSPTAALPFDAYHPDVVNDVHVMYKRQILKYKGSQVTIATFVGGKQIHSLRLSVPTSRVKKFWDKTWHKFMEYRQDRGYSDTRARHALVDKFPDKRLKELDTMTNLVTIVVTPETKLSPVKVEQSFAEGVQNCVLQPIRQWAFWKIGIPSSFIPTAKTRPQAQTPKTIEKYETMLRKIDRYMRNPEFMFGIPEDKLAGVVNDLRVNIEVHLPLDKSEEGTRYIAHSHEKAEITFKFLNTRWNHVDVKHDKLTSTSKSVDVTSEQLREIKEELDSKKTYYTFKKDPSGNVYHINTLHTSYTIQSDYDDAADKFELESGLKNCKLDYLAQRDVSEFIERGLHWNLTRDFVKLDDLDDEVKESLCHVDMTRAYARFYNSDHYAGFPGKITDFRDCEGMPIDFVRDTPGYFMIEQLSLEDVDVSKKRILRRLDAYEEGGLATDGFAMVLPSVELTWLLDLGATFKVLQGCWGSKIDFRFPKEFEQKKQGNVRYYSRWCGQQKSFGTHRAVYMHESETFFQNVLYHLQARQVDVPEAEQTRVSYFSRNFGNVGETRVTRSDNILQGEGVIEYPKKHILHLAHITGFITCYQRLAVFDQLFRMREDKLVRVCVDGIYFHDHDFELNRLQFERKSTVRLGNAQAESYMTRNYCTTFPNLAPFRPHFTRELFLGAGGNGKTHRQLTDTGFINPVYIGPSYKLIRSKAKEYGCKVDVVARAIHPVYMQSILKHNNVLIFDEASMISDKLKKQLFDIYKDAKVIFCGDIGYQLPPVSGQSMTTDGFGNVVTLTENYRFTDQRHAAVINDVRTAMECAIDNPRLKYTVMSEIKLIVMASYQKIKENAFLETYDPHEDIILCSWNSICDEWTAALPDNKWKCIFNDTTNSVGTIVAGPKPASGKFEKRHGFTIHSVQGETYEGRIFIDIRNMRYLEILYTAIARAKRADQIFIIVGKEEHRAITARIYIIESPNLPPGVVYIGSTEQTLEDRWKGHKSKKNKTESKQIIRAGDATIRLLREFQCMTKKDIAHEERLTIAQYPQAVNKKLTGEIY